MPSEPLLIHDSKSNASVTRQNLNVLLNDQFTEIIDLYATNTSNTGSLLSATTAIDSNEVIFTAGHGATAGDTICLNEDPYFFQAGVLGVTNNTVTLDSPLDRAFPSSSFVSIGSKSMNVDGSTTPVLFDVGPKMLPTTLWDVVRVLFIIRDDAAMDSAKFGGITALTNGVVLRKKNGTYKNIFNVKSNGDFAERAYDIEYDDRSAPQSDYFFRCRRTFGGQSKNGVTIRLVGAENDELQIIIQDDLTGLVDFRCVIQGHVIE